jgi:hypothetical protein
MNRPQTSAPTQGQLLGLLTAAFYILFTLLPDSNTAMVGWPWVLFWQVGLLCPVLWLLAILWQKRFQRLGNGLDWLVGLLVLGLLLSTLLAPYPTQARWYAWAVFCSLAALYALNSWLVLPGRRALQLLTMQGYLNLAFIGVSLLLWVSQVYLPELSRLKELGQLGVSLPFDFSNIQLRNGSPIGHQNYVAGYLIVALPLLVGLGIGQKGWRRSLWFGGAALGLVDLYTTSSRAGWLGVVVLLLIGGIALLWHSHLPRLWLGILTLAGILGLAVLGLANPRLRESLFALRTNPEGGESAYRLITATAGWRMGLAHWFSGAGPGATPLLYQQYRPAWAGREAELHYQLHSTPAQLWAELGVWSVLVSTGSILLLTFLSFRWLKSFSNPSSSPSLPAALPLSLLVGLLAYAIVSLFDYQLDNLCISGTLIIYLAILATEFRVEPLTRHTQAARGKNSEPNIQNSPPPAHPLPQPLLPLTGLGIVLAMLIWLFPIHHAWMLSNHGFLALSRRDVKGFVQSLTQAHQQAPWEAYYANQLGWNLGELSLQMNDRNQQQALAGVGVSWLQKGIQAAPQLEFGYTNAGWLLLNSDPKAATRSFIQSARLVPARRGTFYALGLGLLAQQKADVALQALTLEALRDPQLITSPIWKLPDLQPFYGQLVRSLETQLTTLIVNPQNRENLNSQLHQMRGGLRWWVGNLPGARADLEQTRSPLSLIVLDLATGKPVLSELAQLPVSGGTLAIAAWLNPAQRTDLLRQAWIRAKKTAPDEKTLQALGESMSRSTSFDQWLKQNAPSRTYRWQRLGFGINSRHGEGPAPSDFLTVIENIPVVTFFEELLPSPMFAPDMDNLLQPQRDALLAIAQKISQ